MRMVLCGDRRRELESIPYQNHYGASRRENLRHSTPERVVQVYQGKPAHLEGDYLTAVYPGIPG
jgi:hypothetical protein